MKNLKVLSAIIAATMLSGAIGSVSATEKEAIEMNSNFRTTEETEFIQSFTDPETASVAEYLIDSDLSIMEAEKLMDIYEKGLEEIEASSNSRSSDFPNGPYYTGTSFYNGTILSSNQHYGVIIADNGSAVTSTSMRLSYIPQQVSISSSNVYSAHILNGSFNLERPDDEFKVYISGTFSAPQSYNRPAGVLTLPFNVVATSGSSADSYSEATLYHKLTLTRTSSLPLNGRPDTTFSFETYVLGDVNHDGQVTNADCTYVLKYVSSSIDNLSFYYTDVNANVAKIVNDLAQDANCDGTIDLTDASTIALMIES